MKKIKILVIFTLMVTNIFANQSQVENFVERFYQNILERHSDVSGLEYWTQALLSGEKAGSDIARGFIFSQEFQNREVTNGEFITILYRSFFGREPDSDGFDYWKSRMDSGTSKSDILDGFLNSLEFDNLCKEYGISATEATRIEQSEIVSSSTAKITVKNRAYSKNSIVGIYITSSESNYWGENYIDFEIIPNSTLVKPIELPTCSQNNDIRVVYGNGEEFLFYKRYIECEKEYSWQFNDKGIDFDYENTYLYNQDSKYRDSLKECPLYNFIIDNVLSCKLSQLPLIAQESNLKIPTKNLIMSRVLVSQKWMGDRFSELLDTLDNDIKQLLGAVTAIIIDEDINPSHYRNITGAIYLNPRGMWLTPEEAETIVDKDDYRSNYGNGLRFINDWRYIKNGSEYAYYYTDYLYKEHNVVRTIEDIKYQFAELLYHELAHANDFTPLSRVDEMDMDKSILDITIDNFINNRLLSDRLYESSPLTSQKLIDMGEVLYHGEYATEEQQSMSAEDVGLLFNEDVANAMYSYSDPREDFAMLFETTMMRYHYNFERDTGFMIKPTIENPTYKDYILGWGVRNKIAEPNVAERAMFTVNSILPDKTDWSEFFDRDIGEVTLLNAGDNWWDSRVVGSKDSVTRKLMKVPDIKKIYFNKIKD